MSDGTPTPEPGPEPERPFHADREPFAGFELAAMVDRPAYNVGEVVRITITATNSGSRFAEHRFPGWQRFDLSVRDELHREVANAEADAAPRLGDDREPMVERWLPGQMSIMPVYWGQNEGPVVPAWSHDPAGPRVAPGRYRIRVTWLGREPGSRAEVPDAWTGWFSVL